MSIEELQERVGRRVKHTTLGAYGEVVKVSMIYGEIIVQVEWDNGAMTRFTPMQFDEHVEFAPLRKSM